MEWIKAFAADAITISHGSYFGGRVPINAETLFMDSLAAADGMGPRRNWS
jgi:hypothetical protein